MKKALASFFVLILFCSFFLFAFYNIKESNSAAKADDPYSDSFFLESLPGGEKISLAATLAKTAKEIYLSFRSRADSAISYSQNIILKLKNFSDGRERAADIAAEGKKANSKLLEDNGFEIKKFFTDKINFILGKNQN